MAQQTNLEARVARIEGVIDQIGERLAHPEEDLRELRQEFRETA